MLLKICFVCAFVIISVECLYISGNADFWPANDLDRNGAELTPARYNGLIGEYRTARAQPDQTIIVMPNQARYPVSRSSPYGYGSNTMSRGPTVVVNVPDENYNRAVNPYVGSY